VKTVKTASDKNGSMVENDEILTKEQVADRFKCSPKTVIKQAKSGALLSFRLGDLWRFRASDVEAFITRQQLGDCV